MVDTGYQPGTPTGGGLPAVSTSTDKGSSLEDLRKDYHSYLDAKSEEIKEQRQARRYYHGSQWTADQIKALNKRKQPVVTYNHEKKKINSVVGLMASRRGDPKAFPRTEVQAGGAEIATACLRYVCDQQQWETKEGICTLNAGIDGISGVELDLEQGDSGKPGDYDVGFNEVDGSAFFYDPRSLRADFDDARFMGIGKWADPEAVIEIFPDKAAEINAATETGSDLTSNPDSDKKWLDTSGGRKRLRLVDHWYKLKSDWRYCVYIGTVKLAEGISPYRDEKNKTICKYVMFSANVDQDGDRYGFHRDMKSPQDEVNQRRSKALHSSSSRRIIVRDGQGLEVEKIRAEIVKPDGVIVIPPGAELPNFDDAARASEMASQLVFFQEAKAELESGQFNPEAVGNSEASISGRAIQLRQQAGLAELGPFRQAHRGWKLRLYRAIWNAIRLYWTAERAIRVTDDPNSPKWIPINKLGLHPQNGMPAILNQVNALDVDITIDEGPDTVTEQQANEDVLSSLTKSGIQIPAKLAILLSDLDPSIKKQANDLIDQQSQPGPLQQKAAMLDLQAKDLANQETTSKIAVNHSKAMQAGQAHDTSGAETLEWRKALLSSITSIIVAKIGAKTDQESAMFESQIEALLHWSGLQADAQAQIRDQAHQRAMLALQPPPAAQPQAAA